MNQHEIHRAIEELEERRGLLMKLKRLQEEVSGLEIRAVNGCEEIKRQFVHIERLTAEHFAIRATEMRSKRRMEYLCRPRFALFYLASTLLEMGPSLTGRLYDKDHGTIMAGVRRCREIMEAEPVFKKSIEELESKCCKELKITVGVPEEEPK